MTKTLLFYPFNESLDLGSRPVERSEDVYAVPVGEDQISYNAGVNNVQPSDRFQTQGRDVTALVPFCNNLYEGFATTKLN